MLYRSVWCLPHQGFPLIPHNLHGDLTRPPEDALLAHGPHGALHVVRQPEGHLLWVVKRLALQRGVTAGGW